MTDRGSMNYSALVKSAGERLLQYLKDSESKAIMCVGWNGIGRWRIAEYAWSIAVESRLFDTFIWLNLPINDFKNRWKQQMTIAEQLGIQSPAMDLEDIDEIEVDTRTAMKIHEKMEGRKFLVVVGGALQGEISEHIDLVGIGVPSVWRRHEFLVSKIVYVGRWMGTPYSEEVNIELYGTPSDSLWELVCEEAASVAISSSIKGYLSADTVMDCLMYFSLSFRDGNYCFTKDREWMIRYWIAEEIIGGKMEKGEVMGDTMDALLSELKARSILYSDDDITRMSKGVAELVREVMDGKVPNFRHRFWIKSDSLPEEDEWGNFQRMSLLINSSDTINIRFPSSPKCLILSTFILRDTFSDYFEFPQTFFNHMESLRVLDVAHTPIKSLPSSLSSLCNLKLLMLQSCEKLESLPASMRALRKLEFLDLSQCRSLEVIPVESFQLMDRLRVLDLSKTKIHSLPSSVSNLHSIQQLLLHSCMELTDIPDDCFGMMSHLHLLDLSHAISLESLPSSLSNLVNLKKLNLSHCISLKTGLSPQSLQSLTSLEVLDLSCCEKLEDIRDASFQNILPKLRKVRICSTPTPIRLSFRGCQSIEILDVEDLENLEVLDLSCTKVKKLYLNINKNCSLKRLDILPIWYSDVQTWGYDDDDVGARIWVSDYVNVTSKKPTIDYAEFKRVPCFSRFRILITPQNEEGGFIMPTTIDEIQKIHLKRCPSVYSGIYCSHNQAHVFPHFADRRAYGGHVEVCGDNIWLEDFFWSYILKFTDSITFLLNNSVKSLAGDDQRFLVDLKESRVGCCQKMEKIFSGGYHNSDILPSLEVIWASDLPRLTAIFDGVCGAESFTHLKHIFLEYCPRLGTLFTSGVYLKSLETLEIRYCPALENVCQQEVSGGEGTNTMQSLRSLYLLQVPKLKSVCRGFLPQLENVRIRKCQRLRRLPIRVYLVDHDSGDSGSTSLSLSPVEIRGEMEWWKNLEWDDGGDDSVKRRPAHFRPWGRAPTTRIKR